jgi:hypothetical protein
MAARSEFERLLVEQFREIANASLPDEPVELNDLARAAAGLGMHAGLRFDPEPVQLPKLSFSLVGSAPGIVASLGVSGRRALEERELREIIRRVEAVDNALYILTESPGDGWHDIVARAAQALRGAPSKPEPAREPVIEWEWDRADSPDAESAVAREVGGAGLATSYTPVQAVFSLAGQLGIIRKARRGQ